MAQGANDHGVQKGPVPRVSRETKVDQHQLAVGSYEDVLRLDVAVDHRRRPIVQPGEDPQQVAHEGEGFCLARTMILQESGERDPLDVLEHQVEPRNEPDILHEGLDESGDLRVSELPEEAGLSLDQRAPLTSKVRSEFLDGDPGACVEIVGHPGLPRAALTQGTDQIVALVQPWHAADIPCSHVSGNAGLRATRAPRVACRERGSHRRAGARPTAAPRRRR